MVRSRGVSANRITLLRDADGDGAAEFRTVFHQGLDRPFGMALRGSTFYIAATDGVFCFDYQAGHTSLAERAAKFSNCRPVGTTTTGPGISCWGRWATSST